MDGMIRRGFNSGNKMYTLYSDGEFDGVWECIQNVTGNYVFRSVETGELLRTIALSGESFNFKLLIKTPDFCLSLNPDGDSLMLRDYVHNVVVSYCFESHILGVKEAITEMMKKIAELQHVNLDVRLAQSIEFTNGICFSKISSKPAYVELPLAQIEFDQPDVAVVTTRLSCDGEKVHQEVLCVNDSDFESGWAGIAVSALRVISMTVAIGDKQHTERQQRFDDNEEDLHTLLQHVLELLF